MSQQRNEGDAILFFTFTQFGIALPSSSSSSSGGGTLVDQMTADALVAVVVASLALISHGQIQLPSKLPQNIASRHRMCTEIASKVKEMGYPGECGYNQLLYPSESPTRALLTWLVQHLPRPEDDRVEETTGTGALLSRRIAQRLAEWKGQPWLHPSCCTGKPARAAYGLTPLRTAQQHSSTGLGVFTECAKRGIPVEPSILERHALETIEEARYASQLNDYDDTDDGLPGKKAGKRGRVGAGVKSAVRKALTGGLLVGESARASKRAVVSLAGMSLQDIIKSIRSDAAADLLVHGGTAGGRKSRFQAASVLGHDGVAVIGGGAAEDLAKVASAARTAEALAGVEQEDREARRTRQAEEEKARADELTALRDEVETSSALLQSMERTRVNSVSKMRQLESELAALAIESETLEREILVKKKTLEMAPAALENICRLQEVCGTLSGKILQLAQEWEAHRRPLVDLLKAKKRDKVQRRARCRQMADETKRLREEMGAMAADLKDKQERSEILAQEVEDLPKNLTRAVYTSRILDIITSLAKQNVEIEKITTDIHDIQKSINTTTSALQRADAVAEELIYAAATAANADKAVMDTYRRLKNMRAKFEELIDAVTKIGQQEKMARDLETKIDVETGRMSMNNIAQIGQDLLEIQAENDGLIARIKELTH